MGMTTLRHAAIVIALLGSASQVWAQEDHGFWYEDYSQDPLKIEEAVRSHLLVGCTLFETVYDPRDQSLFNGRHCGDEEIWFHMRPNGERARVGFKYVPINIAKSRTLHHELRNILAHDLQ